MKLNFITRAAVPRRTFLRGAGAALALPLLDAMQPAFAAAAARIPPPRRNVFIFAPNGMRMEHWTPADLGTEFSLPPTLEPLAPHRQSLRVLSGLTLDGARPHKDGPGDHARAAASFLTGAHPLKTGGTDIKNDVSVDQVLGRAIGDATRFPTLELGIEAGRSSGSCDSGYSCAYSNNIAWRTESMPVPKEVDPSRVFARMYGSLKSERQKQQQSEDRRQRKSVLDLVSEDARRLRGSLGNDDRVKLDEYLTAVREVERGLDHSRDLGQSPPPGLERPTGIPQDRASHLDLMYRLMTVALMSDMTRTVTFMLGNAGSNKAYREIDVKEGHHTLSHHEKKAHKLEQIGRINRFHVERFAEFLTRLGAAEENGRPLLASTAVVYASAIGDGNRHNHHDLPVLLAGGADGSLPAGGTHTRYPVNTPLCNLYLSLLHRAGVQSNRFGDSTAPLF